MNYLLDFSRDKFLIDRNHHLSSPPPQVNCLTLRPWPKSTFCIRLVYVENAHSNCFGKSWITYFSAASLPYTSSAPCCSLHKAFSVTENTEHKWLQSSRTVRASFPCQQTRCTLPERRPRYNQTLVRPAAREPSRGSWRLPPVNGSTSAYSTSPPPPPPRPPNLCPTRDRAKLFGRRRRETQTPAPAAATTTTTITITCSAASTATSSTDRHQRQPRRTSRSAAVQGFSSWPTFIYRRRTPLNLCCRRTSKWTFSWECKVSNSKEFEWSEFFQTFILNLSVLY